MAGEEQVPVNQMDQIDQGDMAEAQADVALGNSPLFNVFPGFSGAGDVFAAAGHAQMAQVQERAQDKAQLADALAAGTQMVVDPEHLESLAKFFDDEADGLDARQGDLDLLATVEPPGTDPTSKSAAHAYSEVAQARDGRSYREHYVHLIEEFRKISAELKKRAAQSRMDDESNAESLQGGQSA